MKSGEKKPTGKSLEGPLQPHEGPCGTLVKTRQFLVESLLPKIDSASFLHQNQCFFNYYF